MVETTQPWLKLTAWVTHPDAAERPVAIRVRVDGRLVIDAARRDAERVTGWIAVPPGRSRAVVRTSVDRTWRPSEHGGTDTRELGLAIAWQAAPLRGE